MKKLLGILLLLTSISGANAATYQSDSTFGFVDFLLWQVRESGAEDWAENFHGSAELTSTTLVDAPFDWNTGVRLGIGHAFNQKNDDITLIYTHYQADAANQASGKVASAFDGNYFANNVNGASLDLAYSHANIRWQFFYNTVDLNLGRNFKLDPVLQIHLYVGLKAASINQTIYTNWLNPVIPTTFTRATENIKNNFSGLGPTMGADTTWAIYTGINQSLSLIGNLAEGLLYGHWQFYDDYANNSGVTITTFVSSVNGASPVTSGLLGLQWNKSFAKSSMSIRLAYEAQIWFNQVQFYSLSMGRENKPVSVQGGNFEFRYNF